MEMMQNISHRFSRALGLLICILLTSLYSDAQPVVKKYWVRDGRMVIELGKQIKEKDLEAFIQSFDLADLDLKTFFKTNQPDSLLKLGWLIEKNTNALLVLSKPLFTFDVKGSPSDRIIYSQEVKEKGALYPLQYTDVRFGINKFKNKYPFRVDDSVVVFYLRKNTNARTVSLAGTFTNWQQGAFPMQRTDSGWIVKVKLGAGKHWYKFIINEDWSIDTDNELRENDGRGNVNSVYYKTNTDFVLDDAEKRYKKVYLAASFNNWKQKDLPLARTATGWLLQAYVSPGTHTYKFIADGRWLTDEKNNKKLPDGNGGYNSVISYGPLYTFKLDGFTNAKTVILAGSFNGWKDNELYMNKTAKGWELNYVINPGNYEYRFVVDGKWMSDPANLLKGNDGNSFVIIQPNYTFKIKMPEARKVTLAGEFNSWNPYSLPMKKEGEYWVFSIYLSPGKHRYKFVVDGEWIKDPANKLWEQNEWGTGNSVVWVGQQ